MTRDPIPTDEAPIREPRVRLEDLTGGLLWPTLLRGPVLALRPERLGMGVAAVVVLGLIARISRFWNDEAPFGELVSDRIGGPLREMAYGVIALRPGVVMDGAMALAGAPRAILDADPWATLFLGVPMLFVWGIAGVAISRSAACEVALGRVVSWTEGLGLGIVKSLSALMAVLGPLVLIGMIYLFLAVAGWALLTWPVGDVLGSVLYGLGLILALVAVIAGIGLALGWVMLVPAIGCEGTDSLDSIQRVYAYVVGRPVKLVVYLLVALAVGAVAYSVVSWVGAQTVAVSVSAASEWSGERGAEILTPDVDLALDAADVADGEDGDGATVEVAENIVGFWHALVLVIVGGFVVSYIHTAGTLVYLLCRRVNDGQEIAELWTPDAAG